MRAALRVLDARILADAPTATSHSIARLKRWLDAGWRAPDLERLIYTGHDSVRAVMIEVLSVLPAPVAWSAVEFVRWIEVGHVGAGWLDIAHSARTPSGDSAHEIALCGMSSDDEIRDVVPHELGHHLHRALCTVEPTRPTVLALERDTRLLLLARDIGMPESEALAHLADRRTDGEYLAEAAAAAWGFTRPPLHCEAMRRRRAFIAELNAAAELVPSIERACAIGGTP